MGVGEGRSHPPLCFALAEAVHVQLSDEGSKLAMSKEGRQHQRLKLGHRQHADRGPRAVPTDDWGQVFSLHDLGQLADEGRYTGSPIFARH